MLSEVVVQAHRTSALRGWSKASSYAALLIALGACAAEKGMDDPAITTGGIGGAGGAGGASGLGGAGGAGGGGGMAPVGGMGGAGGMMAGMGGAAGDAAITGGMGGMGGVGGMAGGGAGGASGEGGMGGAGGDDMMWEDKGMGDGTDVITIGDSYMQFGSQATGLGIQWALESVSGRDYRNYGLSGTQVLTEAIPNQYNDAVAENPVIKTVIMTGGGNDILLGRLDCSVIWDDASCRPTIDMVQARFDQMRVQMAEDMVEDVIIVSYGYPDNAMLHHGLNYSRMLLPESCKTTDTPRCHYIDPVEELEGYISPADGIHPTKEGYDILGQMVWDLMQERGIRR
jgi:hypothetical protein